MSHRPAAALAVACALLLPACSEEPAVVEATAPATATPVDPAPTTAPADDSAPGADPAPATSDPDDDAAAGVGDPAAATVDPALVEGGAEGQAAADRAKAFLLALVSADADACEMLLSFSDPELPMTAVTADLELCRAQLPATMESTVQAQGLGEEGVEILEAMQIRGAEVQEDTAVIDRDNYSPLFADAMGDATITLRKVDGRWYVDLDAYLRTP
ncbi:hypothetical protein [Ornithinimicrobium flavum]|uniref:hypothetical protein n=1 Tax=Ornithinimicrobium flavum TaxID=1288636 RepID=UPI0010701874|nr:hypothetical protein [Ornithinimicrobium flavum]